MERAGETGETGERGESGGEDEEKGERVGVGKERSNAEATRSLNSRRAGEGLWDVFFFFFVLKEWFIF